MKLHFDDKIISISSVLRNKKRIKIVFPVFVELSRISTKIDMNE